MRYNFNGKNINIPDKELQKNMEVLSVTKEEAIEIWLEDEGYLDNEEQNALDKKAKDNRMTATIHQAKAIGKKKTQKERVRKENPTKEMVIKKITSLLIESDFAENVTIANPTKIITFTIGNTHFTIDLIQNRAKKST